MFWIMSTDLPSNLYGWFLSRPVLRVLHEGHLGKSHCFRISVIFCRSLPSSAPNSLLFSQLLHKVRIWVGVKSICHSNKKEHTSVARLQWFNLDTQQDCTLNIYLLVVLFCVSGSSTWGSPIQGISRSWILPFRINCIWSLSVAKSFMITWWIKFNYWPSGYKKPSAARHFPVCVGSGFNYGWSTVARVIVSEAGKWGTRVARRRYGPRHCLLSWSSRLSIW